MAWPAFLTLPSCSIPDFDADIVEIVATNELALRYEVTHPDGRRESVHQRVSLTWQALHLGGHRPWFSCPVCGRRTAIVYAGRGASRFACRKCYNLAYRVENGSISDRWGRRHQRLWKLLGRDLAAEDGRWMVIRRLGLENESPAFLRAMGLEEEDLWPVWGKPRHMHWRTYDRVLARIHDSGDNLPRLRFEPPPDTSKKNRPRSSLTSIGFGIRGMGRSSLPTRRMRRENYLVTYEATNPSRACDRMHGPKNYKPGVDNNRSIC